MDYLLYVAAGIAGVGFISLLIDIITMRNNSVESYEVIRCKNKTRKSSRYCYPKVVAPNGEEFFVYSANTKGHDVYQIGAYLEFYAPGLFNRKPRCKIGFYKRTLGIFFLAVAALAAYLGQNFN